MSRTDNIDENWLLFQARYDYIAVPAELGVEVLKRMKIVSKAGSKIALADGDCVSVAIVTGEAMTVALVRAKMSPPEEPEKGA